MSRRASLRRAASLLFGRMRRRLALATLAGFVVGCASMRGVAAIPRPVAPVPELQTIANSRIDVWEHRLHTRAPLRQATEDTLARGAAYLPRLCAILDEEGLPSGLALLPVVES